MSEIKDNVQLALKEFSTDENGNDLIFIDGSTMVPLDRKVLPVPELIPFILSGVLGFPNLGRGEKIRWQICFKYKNVLCNIAHQKFGVRLYYLKLEKNDLRINPDEIIGKLIKGLRIIEKSVLQGFSKHQLSQGNVTIPNIYHKLDGMYQYFRENAEREFNFKAEQKHNGDALEDIANHMNLVIRSTRNGFYNTIAMVDAFFSKTENLFIMVLPFINYNREKDNLLEKIGSRWQDKFKRIFQIETDVAAKRFYDQLVNLKENLRNTFAHGGFEKAGASLFFHLPKVGAIPVILTKIKDSPHFNFFPIEEDKFNNICALLDQFETWLKSGKLAQGIKYIESGLNVPFDEESISKFNEAMESDDEFDKLIEHWSYLNDQDTNMDF